MNVTMNATYMSQGDKEFSRARDRYHLAVCAAVNYGAGSLEDIMDSWTLTGFYQGWLAAGRYHTQLRGQNSIAQYDMYREIRPCARGELIRGYYVGFTENLIYYQMVPVAGRMGG